MSRTLVPVRVRAFVLAALLTFGASMAIRPAAAGAVPAPNTTQLTLDPVLTVGFKALGVRLTPIAPATAGSAGLYFPVGRQNVNSSFAGTVRHTGGFQLQYGKLKIGFRNLVIQTKAGAGGSAPTGTISAEPIVNGVTIPLQFPISGIAPSGLINQGLLIGKTKLTIDPTILGVINKALGVTIIKPGQSWATSETRLPWTSVAAAK